MKRIITVLSISAAITGIIAAVPFAAVGNAPAAEVISAKTVSYAASLNGSGALSFMGQSDVTSALPLVIARSCVSEGDLVQVGDTVAIVDKNGTSSFIESLGQLPQLAIASASLSTAMSLIPDEIAADRNGLVISAAGNGTSVEAGSAICTIASTDQLVLTVPVGEQYISQIDKGCKASFSLTAYPDTIFTGTVSKIAGAARNRYIGSVLETVVDVQILPDRYDERLKAGLTADVQFTLTEPKNICVLPYEAIGQDETGEFVYVYADGKAVKRRICTGAEFSDGTEVIKGITAEDKVFTSPDAISDSRFVRLEQP